MMKHLKDLNWNHLYYFYEVARLHSIKRVSDFTNHSPSTISEQIKKLENHLGAKLFTRSKSGVFLTAKGEMLFEHARVIFAEGYRVLEKFSSDEVGGYPVKVGVDNGISSPMASDYIANYWDLYARFGVVNTINQGDPDILIQNIVQDHIDWGLSLAPSKRKTLISEQVMTYKLKLCVAQAIQEKFKKEEDIPEYLPFVETTRNHPFQKKTLDFLRSKGLVINEICHSDKFSYTMSLLNRGRAICLLPESLIKQNKNITTIYKNLTLEVPVYAIWKQRNEALVSIGTLKSLIDTNNKAPRASIYHQLKVSEVPKDKLK